MNLLDRITGVDQLRESYSRLEESLRQERDTNTLLEESVRTLELQLEDEGWQRLSAEGEREFSRQGLAKIISLSRLMFLKNPLVNRAVLVQSYYVWAQGVSITSDDESTQKLITAFLNDPKNQAELTGHQARTMKEQDLQTLGNLFFVLFSNLATGEVQVRTVPVEEISEIVCDPEDSKSAWFYKREWTQSVLDIGTGVSTSKPQTAYYPSLQYSQTATERIPTIGGKPVVWDAPVYHVRVGGLSDMRFGIPETFAAIDWAKAYKSFLEDWATIVRSYARFAWNLNTTGGAKAVAAAKTRLNTTVSTSRTETNPPATTGGVFISSGAEMQPIKTSGATTSAEDGRRLLLMVAASFGLPETFFGDMQTGNLATAKSLDRPTELKFRDRQELWRSILDTILQYVVARKKRAPGGMQIVGSTEQANITIKFPPILEHDVSNTVSAIVSAATLDGKSPAGTIDWRTTARLVLEALGVVDIDEILALVADEREEQQARREEMAAAVTQSVNPQMAEAVKALREAIQRVHERMAAA